MEEDVVKKLSELTLPELKNLRHLATKKITNIRMSKSLRVVVYLQAEVREQFETALLWAFENGLIKRKTKWSFAKFSILNTMNLIQEEIKKKQLESQSEIIRPQDTVFLMSENIQSDQKQLKKA